jgi:hypothetical protein
MGILKGILHHWNKTSSAYDTIHPETEVAQVTDWNKGIVNTLASTGLSSLVNVLSSDSLLALLIKKVFDATGVKYSLGQNGYVCWGALFGGVITQWGTADCNKYFTLPLNYPDRYIMVATFLTMSSDITNELAVKIDSRSTARINCLLNEQVTSPQAVWISIGV